MSAIRAFGMFGRRLTKYYPPSSMRQASMSMLMKQQKATKKGGSSANGKTRNASSQTWG